MILNGPQINKNWFLEFKFDIAHFATNEPVGFYFSASYAGPFYFAFCEFWVQINSMQTCRRKRPHSFEDARFSTEEKYIFSTAAEMNFLLERSVEVHAGTRLGQAMAGVDVLFRNQCLLIDVSSMGTPYSQSNRHHRCSSMFPFTNASLFSAPHDVMYLLGDVFPVGEVCVR